MNLNERVPHQGQIVVSKEYILQDAIRPCAYEICENMLLAFYNGKQASDYLTRLISIGARLSFIDVLIFEERGRYEKLQAEEYINEIFAGYAGSEGEAEMILKRVKGYGTDDRKIRDCYRLLKMTAKFIGPMLANISEIKFVSEWAYAIDYVLFRDGRITCPVFNEGGFIPVNYSDYSYIEGIVEKVRKYMM